MERDDSFWIPLVLNTDLNIDDVHPGWSALLGHERDDLLGRRFVDYLSRESQPVFVKYRGRLEVHGRAERIHLQLVHQNGSLVDVDFEGNRVRVPGDYPTCYHCGLTVASTPGDVFDTPIGFDGLSTGFLYHTTKQLQDKVDLVHQAENLALIFDSIPSFLALINANGEVEVINRRGAEMSGLDQLTVRGRQGGDVLSCIHASQKAGCGRADDCRSCPIRTRVNATFASGKAYNGEEGEMTLTVGGMPVRRTFLISTVLLSLDNEKKVLLSLVDITEAKQLEEEKRGLRTQLFQAQKLESIGRLAGGVAHDLNNLLVPILGYAEIMFEDFATSDPKRDAAKQIVSAGRRAGDLLRQLLAFSRKQQLSYSVFNLNDLLRNFEKLLRRTLREDIIMTIRCNGVLPNISGDKGQLEQVLMNLVVNAQDAMPDGGNLIIDTAAVTLLAPDLPTWESFVPGEHVRLRISDTGLGMDQQTAEQIFEPFFTTKPSDKGTGLGLSTVHGIVLQHGGSVNVMSRLGEGTCFQIFLPTVAGDVLDPGDEEEERAVTGSASLLVVEDDDRMRELLERALARRGYQVLVCENGEKALAVLAKREAAVDLLLTDVVMPGMNGRELYSRALQTNPELKILYMSGHTRDILSHRGIEEGTVQLIEKPFSIRNLIAKIEEVLGR